MYVVGFLLDPTLSKVVLIRKTKPEWQVDLLNGVGGKIEPDEGALTAMHREFLEETGVGGLEWKPYLTLHTPHSEIHFFRAVGNVHYCASVTDEAVGVFDISNVMDRCDTMPNIRWCIQMARTFHFGENAQAFEVKEVMAPEWSGDGYRLGKSAT